MIVVKKNVKDLDKFLAFLKTAGYSIKEGAHAVITDQSEIESISVRTSDGSVAVIISHFITPYYRAEASGISGENEYLEKLLEIKHSGEKWRIPVDDLVIVVFDESILDLIDKYSDEYPVGDGESLVKAYRSRNPGYAGVINGLLARILETS